MKKFIALFAATAMIMGLLSGCGSSSKEVEETAQETETANETGTEAEVETESEADGMTQVDDKIIFTVGFDAEFP